ncbi:MATE family efflux transporter [Fluviicola taffensis]|uniref:Multidrug-efflux transporter n=1 Tax=Fluviicola taffensis (strain DSM 16823 / NCIMB 13979 / RW262) TaxID=755732 RepID=F2IDZ2_FLUTR|nr:MATE family efflux transporter [Fluviicola taffensis]AEA45556.1 MATE efflux family protein [Fluviicola taffensis DSM 16823]
MLDIRYSSILKMALPMMLSGFIQSVISITDAAFLSRYSTLAYDASGSAGLWYITLYMVFMGLGDGAQIAMAQKVGEKNSKGFVAVFQSNFIILVIAAALLTLLVQLCMPTLMGYMVTNHELAHAEQSFLEIRSYSFWAATITISIQASYLAVGKTSLVLVASLIAAISNIILDYFLIFGIGPFPRLGLEGAAIASTTAEFLAMLFLLSTLIGGRLKNEYPIWKERLISKFQLKENLKIGVPLLFQGMVALSIWTIFFIWIEQMGGDNLTVSLNIRYVYFLAFIPIWGFAAATKTYIAQYFGANQLDKLQLIQGRIQLLTIGFLLLTFHGAILYPEALIRLVSEKPEHIEESAQILRIVSGSILIYGFGSVYFQTISGIGRTRITFLVECLSTALYILSAYLFIKVWKWQLQWVWLVEYVYFITMGLSSLIYLKLSNWTKEEKAQLLKK